MIVCLTNMKVCVRHLALPCCWIHSLSLSLSLSLESFQLILAGESPATNKSTSSAEFRGDTPSCSLF